MRITLENGYGLPMGKIVQTVFPKRQLKPILGHLQGCENRFAEIRENPGLQSAAGIISNPRPKRRTGGALRLRMPVELDASVWPFPPRFDIVSASRKNT